PVDDVVRTHHPGLLQDVGVQVVDDQVEGILPKTADHGNNPGSKWRVGDDDNRRGLLAKREIQTSMKRKAEPRNQPRQEVGSFVRNRGNDLNAILNLKVPDF